MQRLAKTTVAATAAAIGLYAGGASADVTDTRMLEESLAVPAAEPLVVIVKNIVGSITVTGHDVDRVEMRATETIRGNLRADIDRARAEVELRTEQEPGRIAFRVRHGGDDGDRRQYGQGWEGYTVEYDIELRVPRTATLDLATVNDGDVTTAGVSGNFTVRNVNGAVQLGAAGGNGSVTTVNGKIVAAFASAPTGPTSFKTVNGDVDVTLLNALAADLTFQTMNGDVFTDFEVEQLAQTPVKQPGGDLFVMRANRNSAFRVGAGGDPLSFNTLNGNIYVRKATR